jgi:HEAT repeat protein
MIGNRVWILGMAAGLFALGLLLPAALADEAVDRAFVALKSYDWGADRSVLAPIDQAVPSSHQDAAARKALETRLAAVLKTDASSAAKDYVFRQLSLMGSADCVPTVAALLGDEKLSHMARYALERIPDADAVDAMRNALPTVTGRLKVGVINSLGVRRDEQAVSALQALLDDKDEEVAAAAAVALGSIGNSEAAKALAAFHAKAPKSLQLAAADAYLACAERLLADNQKLQAIVIYKTLAKESSLKHVGLAAKRGLLTAMSREGSRE